MPNTISTIDSPPRSPSPSPAYAPGPSGTQPRPTALSAAIGRLNAAETAHTQSSRLIAELHAQIRYTHHVKLDLQRRYWSSKHEPKLQVELQVRINDGRALIAEARNQLNKAKETRVKQWVLVKRERARVWALISKERVIKGVEMYLAASKLRRGG